jgi:hypothetical protein
MDCDENAGILLEMTVEIQRRLPKIDFLSMTGRFRIGVLVQT